VIEDVGNWINLETFISSMVMLTS